MSENVERSLWTKKEYCNYVGISERTSDRHFKTGKDNLRLKIGRATRYDPQAVMSVFSGANRLPKEIEEKFQEFQTQIERRLQEERQKLFEELSAKLTSEAKGLLKRITEEPQNLQAP